MTQPRDLEAEVLKRLLSAADADGPPDDLAHPDDETLALLAEGALSGAERAAAVEHLAVCSDCRRVTSLLLTHVEEPGEKVTLLRPVAWITPPIMAWATAAILLVAGVGLFFNQRSTGQPGGNPSSQVATGGAVSSDQKDTTQSREATPDKRLAETAPQQTPQSPVPGRPPADALADAGSPGKTAGRLANIIALASAGRLSDYGYGFDGDSIRSRDWPPSQVKSLDALPEGRDLTSQLNRGQLLLKFGHAQKAAEAFHDATQHFPNSALAWLGLGLAHYVDNEHDAAAKDFRKALELDPKNQVARINLAVTLESQRDRQGALQLWKSLLQEDLTAADRDRIQQRIRAIEAEPAKSETR